jgi:hypothetical protein
MMVALLDAVRDKASTKYDSNTITSSAMSMSTIMCLPEMVREKERLALKKKEKGQLLSRTKASGVCSVV